jgi:hypothetical protein
MPANLAASKFRPTRYVWPRVRPDSESGKMTPRTDHGKGETCPMIAIPLSRPQAAWVAVAGCVLLLVGCANQAGAPASRERVFAADMVGGARKCEAPTPSLTDGQTSDVQMKVANDGGWCGVTVAQRSGRPFDSGLLSARPSRGKVAVNRVGDVTRIAYTPAPGFTGTDSFAVRLIPGESVVRVAVTVTAN